MTRGRKTRGQWGTRDGHGGNELNSIRTSTCSAKAETAAEDAVPNYRGVQNGVQNIVRRTQAGPGRTVKQQHEQISPNLERTIL